MQSIKANLQPHLGADMPLRHIEDLPFRSTIASSVSSSALRNDHRQKQKYNVNTKFSRKAPYHSLSQVSFEGAQSQANSYISLIKDPLWKHVCIEVVNMMGPYAFLKMRECRLGSFSSTERMINIYCQSKETAQFTQEYDFVILGCLQQYFPACKKLRVIRTLH